MGRDKKPANLDTLRSLAEAEIERVADACDPLERVYLQLYAISDWFGWSEAERAVLVLAVLANTDPDSMLIIPGIIIIVLFLLFILFGH